MQDSNFQLSKRRVDSLPIIERFAARVGLREILKQALRNERYVNAVDLLVKSVMLNPQALYRVNEWRKGYAETYMPQGEFSDDVLGRALERLFVCDRASLQTRTVLSAIHNFGLSVERIHNDATTVKFFGAYRRQNRKAVQLKRGYSKDHRPDLKQLVVNVSITSDGGIPIHFKQYDGNTTESTTHLESWIALRGLLGKTDFLYVADSKLCATETLLKIDREQGKFITVVPQTRKETQTFEQEVYDGAVRWSCIWRKKVPGYAKRLDVFEVAEGFYQLQEGFTLYWYRSSQKRKRDAEAREEHVAEVVDKLTQLQGQKKRQPRSAKTLLKHAQEILKQHGALQWFTVEVVQRTEERYTKTGRGRSSKDSLYRKLTRTTYQLAWKKNQEQINRSAAVDGIFPLTTNTPLKPLQILKYYKYQPTLEKRFSLLKSDLAVAPVFLKKNERIEALLFVAFLAEMLAALIERELRGAMARSNIEALHTLPEGRPSRTPTWEQISRLFEHHSRYELRTANATTIQTFADEISQEHQRVLDLLQIDIRSFA